MSASDHRARARQALNGRWIMAVLVGLVASILGGGGNSSLNINLEQYMGTIEEVSPEVAAVLIGVIGVLGLVAMIYSGVMLLIGGVIQLGYARYNLNLIDGREAQIGDLFSYFGRFLDALLLRLLMGLFISLWTLLFIIPGIVAAHRYAMAPYIMAEDPNCTPMEAIRRSKAMMDGYKMDLFLLTLSFIGWELLSILTLGVGYLVVNPYIAAAKASFYRDLQYRPRQLEVEFDPYYVQGEE